MKKILLAGAALALIAGSASAQSTGYAGTGYGQDGAAWWQLNANVAQFCKLSSTGGVVSATNGTASFNSAAGYGNGGSSAEADGVVTLDIQNTADNTVKRSGIQVNYAKTQCNTPFNVRAQSDNGGLRTTSTGSADFATIVPYNMDVQFDSAQSGIVPASTLSGGGQLVITNNQPEAGDFKIGIGVDPLDNILLAGTYRDFLRVTMAPTMVAPAPSPL